MEGKIYSQVGKFAERAKQHIHSNHFPKIEFPHFSSDLQELFDNSDHQ